MMARHVRVRTALWSVARGEGGGALPAVLVLVVVLSALVGSVLAVYVAERRLVRRDFAREQARYAAEAGMERALYLLAYEPAFRASGEQMEVPGVGLPVHAWVRPFGVYAEVRAVAATRPAGPRLPAGDNGGPRTAEWIGVRALVGAALGPGYGYALVLGDSLSALTLTGTARLTGDVLTGPLGARPGQLQGRGFRGELRGRVLRAADRPREEADLPLLPPAVLAFAEETFGRYDRAVERGLEGEAFAAGLRTCSSEPAALFGSDFVRGERVFREGLTLACASDGSRVDAEALRTVIPRETEASPASASPPPSGRRPLLLLSDGALVLDGSETPLVLPPGSIVFARGALRLRGAVEAADALLIGETVDATGRVRVQGQVLARRSGRLDGGARIEGTVTVYAGRRRPGTAALDLGDARVGGVVLYAPEPEQADSPGADLILRERAEVRGVLYAAGSAELAGRVLGSAIVRRLYFYASPAAYTNWLRAGHFDRTSMPDPLLLPLALGGAGDGRPARPAAFGVVEEGLTDPPGSDPTQATAAQTAGPTR